MDLPTLLLILSILLALLAALGAWRPRPDGRESLRPLEESIRRERLESQQFLVTLLQPLREELRLGRLDQGAQLDVALQRIQERLERIGQSHDAGLEAMRRSLDQRLQVALEQRIGESFRLVSDRLEQVQRGLGEMQALAQDVGGLKRALTNVKNRGVLGEAQLGALLEQFLAPGQYAANVRVKPRSPEVVEYAVRLPGPQEGEPLWLPIDAKFPLEDYQRLVAAWETGDAAAAEAAGKALEVRLLAEGRAIRDKYLAPPATTDFALLFLPFEGLFGEALRRPGLLERLQRDCRVTLVGPTTLTAFLNSLQVGFRTLAISKRSAEAWKLLGAVKADFDRFGEALTALDRKLDEAKSRLGAVSERSRILGERLTRVDSLPEETRAGDSAWQPRGDFV